MYVSLFRVLFCVFLSLIDRNVFSPFQLCWLTLLFSSPLALQVVEIRARYDHICKDANKLNCTVNINIDEDMSAPIYMYYELTNYYQNHRRYVKSRSDAQLRGKSGGIDECAPLETDEAGTTLYPCGLVANSFFIGEYFVDLVLICILVLFVVAPWHGKLFGGWLVKGEMFASL